MTQEVGLLSTREQASLILISIFLSWVLSKKDLRANIPRIIGTFLSPGIMLPLVVMFAYVSFEVWIGFQLGLWGNQLAKATVIWTVAAGVVLSSKGILEANKDPLFFRKTAAAAITPTVFVAFFMNLASLSLLAEVVLQLFLVPVTMLSAFTHARADREHERVKKLCNGILALVGFSWMAFTVHHVHETWNQLDTHLLFQKLALPMWLTIGLLPFLFALSLYAAYERPFRHINSETRMFGVRWRARIAIMLTLHFKARDVAHFQHFWAKTLVETNTLGAARAVVRQFEESLRDGERAIVEEEYRLRRYAGVDGTDSEGQRLDRREFKETIKALRWLATCHMGHYRKRSRYDRNLLGLLGNNFAAQGLTGKSGIEMKVAKDGQWWFAYRRTISGWCFAIGAAGPPPDQWEHDGRNPPCGFPGEDPSWGDGPFGDTVNRNWD